MTQVNVSKTSFSSYFPGLGNPALTPLSFAVASHTLNSGTPVVTQTSNLAVGSSSDVVGVRMQLTGLDSNWYLTNGFIDPFYNTSDQHIYSPIANIAYDIAISYIFTGGNMAVFVGETLGIAAASHTVPAFTLSVQLNRYASPFS